MIKQLKTIVDKQTYNRLATNLAYALYPANGKAYKANGSLCTEAAVY
jgi:hypothetical protein